jgi:hypothetical protein
MSPKLEELFIEHEHRDFLDNHQAIASTSVSHWGAGARRVPSKEIRRT